MFESVPVAYTNNLVFTAYPQKSHPSQCCQTVTSQQYGTGMLIAAVSVSNSRHNVQIQNLQCMQSGI
jgi:hypothetical protein